MGIALPLSHLSLLLLLSISFNHVGHLVSADDTLIQLQCHNAEVPSTCIQCVKSDPRSQSADKVGIAAIIITCLSNNAKTLSKNMTVLASAAHDKNVKMVLQSCEKGFSVATTDLANATNMLGNKDYDKTNGLVSAALRQEVDCNQYASEYKVTIPYRMVYDMRVYEELSDAALRIIDRF
ncbi:hypothetical protein like AT4G00872 [Hibiscus trionum]|uniref:Pectinesterase inhibitor domain-containing protein n=1 Tax=Hibiscus trionum TaxID=183268 RepID=A0A9W7LIK8_HIBTR|nr:hypothetical protein like AT4G00872 [Hibiscus trionum]